MARLDARVKTQLIGDAHYTSKSLSHDKKVLINEISLSSLQVQGLSRSDELVRIKPKLPNGKKIELEGLIVRVDKNVAVLELYCPDMAALKVLWEHIRDKVAYNSDCPYCGTKRSSGSTYCKKCCLPLNFEDGNYLENHFRQTFLKRIEPRIEKLNSDDLEGIIRHIDEEVLKGKGQLSAEEFVGTSPAMLEVFSMIRRVAPTDVNVLILGESGTGKELTAKAIHERSQRKDKPFIAINSAAIPEGLLEAELFGFEKGAFTGAHAARKGKFEQAAGGTIFLDEIGDLSTNLQAKVLRFLEDRVVERVGGKGGKKVDVRIIAATNCQLKQKAEEGLFRSDLYFRLDGFTIKLPPLRDRGDDQIVLAKYILKKITHKDHLSHKVFSAETITAIKAYDWPGNVREMINKVRRGLLMSSGEEILPADMDLQSAQNVPEQSSIKKEVADTQKRLVEKTLHDHNFVIARAAKTLGISRPSLYSLMKKYGINRPRK